MRERERERKGRVKGELKESRANRSSNFCKSALWIPTPHTALHSTHQGCVTFFFSPRLLKSESNISTSTNGLEECAYRGPSAALGSSLIPGACLIVILGQGMITDDEELIRKIHSNQGQGHLPLRRNADVMRCGGISVF